MTSDRFKKEPDHQEFIDKLRQKYVDAKPQRTWYLWELIYRRRLLLFGVLVAIVLITFSPIKCMLNRKDFRSSLENTLSAHDYDKALVIIDDLYRKRKIDRQEHFYYRRTAIEGEFKLLYEQAENALKQHAYADAAKHYRGFIDFFYENKANLNISSSVFSVFEREIYEEIKYMPAEEMAQKKTESLLKEYQLTLEGITPDADVLGKMEKLLDAIMKLKKIESEQYL